MRHVLTVIFLVAWAASTASQADGATAARDRRTTPAPSAAGNRGYDEGDGRNVVSPDGKRTGGYARRGKTMYVVIDGKEVANYRSVSGYVEFENGPGGATSRAVPHDDGRVVFSPDSKRVAYMVRNGRQWQFVVDGQVLPVAFDALAEVAQFSPDSARFAFIGKNLIPVTPPPTPDGMRITRSEVYAVVDGRKEADFLEIYPFQFSRDGKHYAYKCVCPPKNGGKPKQAVVFDGVKGGEYDSINEMVLSEGPTVRVGYVVSRGSGTGREEDFSGLAVIDGRQEKVYHGVRNLVFSDDGRHYVCTATLQSGKAKRECVVVDGVEGEVFEAISVTPVFIPGGDGRVAYGAREIASPLSNARGRQFAVVGTEKGRAYSRVSDVVVSADGKHVGYIAWLEDGRQCAVADGVEGTPAERVSVPIFDKSSAGE